MGATDRIVGLKAALLELNLQSAANDTGAFEIAAKQPRPDNSTMSDQITRPELDAKLATIDARMEGRLARIDDRLASIEGRIGEQKRSVWAAAAATIATIVATAALVVSSFDSGRDTATLIGEAEKRIEATVAKAVSDIQAATRSATPPPEQAAPATPKQ